MQDFRSMYDTNIATGAFLIEVNLKHYIDFYHEWDNARFKKRDIHPELAEFLLECSEEIPGKESVEVSFCVEARQRNEEQEQRLKESYSQYFSLAQSTSRRSVLRLISNVLISVVIAALLLVFAEVLSDILTEGLFSTVLIEGFYVGGWVFLWEAVYALAFELPGKIRSCNILKRLLYAPLSFLYEES